MTVESQHHFFTSQQLRKSLSSFYLSPSSLFSTGFFTTVIAKLQIPQISTHFHPNQIHPTPNPAPGPPIRSIHHFSGHNPPTMNDADREDDDTTALQSQTSSSTNNPPEKSALYSLFERDFQLLEEYLLTTFHSYEITSIEAQKKQDELLRVCFTLFY
jgi:hypothetical protein